MPAESTLETIFGALSISRTGAVSARRTSVREFEVVWKRMIREI